MKGHVAPSALIKTENESGRIKVTVMTALRGISRHGCEYVGFGKTAKRSDCQYGRTRALTKVDQGSHELAVK